MKQWLLLQTLQTSEGTITEYYSSKCINLTTPHYRPIPQKTVTTHPCETNNFNPSLKPESIIKKKNLSPDYFTEEFYQMFKELIPIYIIS